MANAVGTGTTSWTIDPAHTTAAFVAKHMMITSVRGSFANIQGTIQLDESDFTRSSVEAKIDSKTITSGVDQRDTHLRSADFLDVENWPDITFKSTRIEKKSGDDYVIYGDLAIRGTAKQIALNTTYEGRGKGMDGKDRIGFSAKAVVNRKDWGLNWNVALEAGGVLVSDKVTIELDVQAIQA